MLRTQNLTIAYDNEPVVQDLSWELRSGEIVGLLGVSGSGKSTLARALHGHLPFGARIVQGSITRQGRAALIPQEPSLSLNPFLRAGVQVAHAALPHHPDQTTILALFESLGLEDPQRLFRSYPHQLSGGQQQRLAWAQALVQNPSLLIADEPTTALDPILQRELVSTICNLARRQGAAVLWISHDPQLLAAVATRIAVLHQGRLLEEGPVSSILHNPQHAFTQRFLEASK